MVGLSVALRFGLRAASQVNTRRLGSRIGSLRGFELFGGLRAPTSDRRIVKRLRSASFVGVALARPRDALNLRRVDQVARQDPRFSAPAVWVQEAATGHIATVDNSSRSTTTKSIENPEAPDPRPQETGIDLAGAAQADAS